jgi:hypothetical protein
MVANQTVQRDAHIAVDDEIMGGTPVIRGTRITVYAVLGRIDHGDTIGVPTRSSVALVDGRGRPAGEAVYRRMRIATVGAPAERDRPA